MDIIEPFVFACLVWIGISFFAFFVSLFEGLPKPREKFDASNWRHWGGFAIALTVFFGPFIIIGWLFG
jgi:hypothetical protein